MRKVCAECGGQLSKESLGMLGHGGISWIECENKCKNIWGQREKELD